MDEDGVERELQQHVDLTARCDKLRRELARLEQLIDRVAAAAETGQTLCGALEALRNQQANSFRLARSAGGEDSALWVDEDEVEAQVDCYWAALSERSAALHRCKGEVKALLADLTDASPALRAALLAAAPPRLPARLPVASSSSGGAGRGGPTVRSVVAVYSCEGLLLRAAKDFRLDVVPPAAAPGGRVELQWELVRACAHCCPLLPVILILFLSVWRCAVGAPGRRAHAAYARLRGAAAAPGRRGSRDRALQVRRVAIASLAQPDYAYHVSS